MVLCLMTLTDLQTRRAGLSASAELVYHAGATRCTDSRQTWHGQWAHRSALLCKILPQSAQRVGMRPQNFHFLVKCGRLP